MEDEEEASDNHLALLLLFMPILARIRARIEKYWDSSKGSVRLSEIAEESVIEEATAAILTGMDDMPPEIVAAVSDISLILEQQLRRARITLFDAKTLDEALKAVDILDVAVSKIETINSNIETRAENERTKGSTGTDESVVWDSERDACVKCLAYAGKVMDDDGFFDGANKFGVDTGSVGLPPLHPNCRCKVRKVSKRQLGEVVSAMAREAERSVMRGFSRPSESPSARLRATQTLLNRGSSLPASVQAYGRRSIRQGDYPRGREVPGGQ